MNILYLPIYEPGAHHDVQRTNKHGLRDALAKRGTVTEFDYVAPPQAQVMPELIGLIESTQPDLLFLQLQGTDRVTADDLHRIRENYPALTVVNWNGDFWPEHLTSPDMLALLDNVDLQMVINGSVLPVYAELGINARYWQFGYETATRELPDVPAYDVVFLGNNYSEKRAELYKVLRSLPYKVGIYGSGWPESDGQCTYDFAYGEALYRKAKIAIDDSQWPDAEGYTSNRILQAMYAGCFVLHQYVKGMGRYTDLWASVHYAEFNTLEDLPQAVDKWLTHDEMRGIIASTGQRAVTECHSFDERVNQLFDEFLPAVRHE